VLYYLPWNYRSIGDATAAGAKALRAVAPKSVEKNIVRSSTGPIFLKFLTSVRKKTGKKHNNSACFATTFFNK
jgi:hypothetical protein